MTRIFVSLARVPVRRLAPLGVLASLAAVGFAIPATAAAKVTSLTACQAITAPGSYRLDADLTTFSDCFDITASGVTLNLNGHSITTPLGMGSFGIDVAGGAANTNVVGPGTVTGWNTDAIGFDGSNGSVRGVTVTDNFVGISIGGPDNSIRGNVATRNGDAGIVANSGATDTTIIGNYAHDKAEDLVDDNLADCDNNVWRGNDFGTANQSCIH